MLVAVRSHTASTPEAGEYLTMNMIPTHAFISGPQSLFSTPQKQMSGCARNFGRPNLSIRGPQVTTLTRGLPLLTDMQSTFRSGRYQNTGIASPQSRWPWARPLDAESECLKICKPREGGAFRLQWTSGLLAVCACVYAYTMYVYAPCWASDA
jgi:hypothetical protein